MNRTKSKQKFDNEAKVNTANSIKRIRSDYNQPWVGLLRETIQNSTDGWGFNRLQGNLPNEQDLTIEFIVDTVEKELMIRDNAGGMDFDTFHNNLLAIDNPSDDKADGNGAGSYGRGFWVIMSCGEWAELETNHTTGVFASSVNIEGMYDTIQTLDEPSLGSGDKGTCYRIHGVRDDDMSYLSDWDTIEPTLVENFAPLLNDDSVNIEYTIDGETHTPEAPDLNKLRQEYALCEESELEPFTYHGEEHKVLDFTMIDATKMDDEPPWTGVMLFKGNDYLGYPFMKVDWYEPRGIPSTKNPTKMFGWCDASDICRPRKDGTTLENNAHDDIQLSRTGTKTNIQSKVYDVHDAFFKDNYTTEEKTELLNAVQNNVNSLLGTTDAFDTFSKSTRSGTGTGPSPSSPPSVTSLSFLRCKTDKYNVEVGEDISLGIEVNPQNTLDYDMYEISNIQVRNKTEDEIVYEVPSIITELVENEPLEQIIDIFTCDEMGKYVFSAEISGYIDGEENIETKDTSKTTFIVGEFEDASTKDESDKNSEGSVEFISEVSPFTNPDGGKAFIQPISDGEGLRLNVNTAWPAFVNAKETLRGDAFEQKQEKLFTDWGVDAVIDHWVTEKLQDLGASKEILDFNEKRIKTTDDLEKKKVMNNE
jgi:hypothetical protein